MKLLDQMNNDLGIDKQYIRNCATRNNLYAKYYIKKKNGGAREILQPSKELKALQYWLIRNIFNEFPISQYTAAYEKGCSIKKNAICHQQGKYILHTDIVHFLKVLRQNLYRIYLKEIERLLKNYNYQMKRCH